MKSCLTQFKNNLSAIVISATIACFVFPNIVTAQSNNPTLPPPTSCPAGQTLTNVPWSTSPVCLSNSASKSIGDTQTSLAEQLNPVTWVLAALGRVAIVILQVASLVTYLGGTVLNFVIRYTVVDMKLNISGVGAIDLAWTTIRNVANMFFIFILLYAAIKTIIGQGDNARELIVKVVLVAILINFSLFFTKIIIDASNILAITFYDAIAPGALTAPKASWGITGLSNSLMQPLKLQSLWDSANSGELSGDKLVTIGLMGTVVTLIAGFVFFAVAIMFIIRFVVLIFLLILSPLAFMGWILPALKSKVSDKWLDALLGQAIFAPLYFLLTWIVIVISRGLFTTTGTMADAFLGTNAGTGAAPGAAGTFQTTASSLEIFMNFIIMIVFLIASLVLSKEYASRGGSGIQSATKWAMGFAGGATLGSAAWVSRNTLGRAGAAVGDSEMLKRGQKWANARGGLIGGAAGVATRGVLTAGRKVGSGSYDIRGTGLNDSLGAGKAGGKGGFTQYRKDQVKKEEEFAKSLEPSDKVKAKARLELESAQKINTSDTAFADEHKIAVVAMRSLAREKQEELKKQQEEYLKYQNDVKAGKFKADPEEVNRRRKEVDETGKAAEDAEKRAGQILSREGYKQMKIEESQAKVDRLTGISDKDKKTRTGQLSSEQAEAEKNDPVIKKQKELQENINKLTEQIKTATGDIKEQLTTELDTRKKELEISKTESEARKTAIKDEFDALKKSVTNFKSEGEQRKSAFADATEKSVYGKIRGYNYAAAAQIRKGKKSAKDLIDDALKETGEKTEEKPAEAPAPAPEAGGGPKTT